MVQCPVMKRARLFPLLLLAALWQVQAQVPGPIVQPPRWFAGAETMLKIRTIESGVYRLTRDDLAGAGVPVASIDPRSFRLFLGGLEQPLLVRGEDDGSLESDDEILFYAPRLDGGEFGYYDFWETRNALFLRWGGQAGLRYTPENAAPPPEPALSSLTVDLRLEEDHAFHFGDHDNTDGNTSDYLPGKTWMWQYLFKKDTLRIPFTLHGYTGGAVELLLRVKHSSRDPVRVRVVARGTQLDEYDVSDNEIRDRVIAVPAGLLRVSDTLLVINAQIVECPPQNPTCTIERLYVDWARLRYDAAATAAGGYAAVRSVTDTGTAIRRITIGGFGAGAITGLNYTRGTLLQGFDSTGTPPDVRVSAGLRASDLSIFFTREGTRKPVAMTLVTPPNLSALSVGADYIVVTHGSLRTEAERLASYRRTADGYSTLVADVDDIYDVYNFGRKHPKAIRAYLAEVHALSGGLAPRFVLLLGDASWDARALLENSASSDLVPAWGNPVSDNYYIAFGVDSGDYAPYASIARIPAQTVDEAAAVVDKVLEYEALPPQQWFNRFLFSVGGKSVLEQEFYLKPPVTSIMAEWMQPYCLDGRVMVKTRPDLPVSYNDLDTLISEANRGVNWFYFIGHGGTRIIDVGVERPDVFSLKGKYPFFLTMSCNTAHFAEPFETGLNERFILSRENGAIATYGTSGLGEIGHDNVLSDGLFDGMLKKGVRTYGELSRFAKNYLIAWSKPRGNDEITRSTVDQYALFGDPATRLPLAPGPDLAVDASDVSVSPAGLMQFEPTRITAVVRNLGRCLADSVDVRLTISRDGNTVFEHTRRIAPPRLRDSVTWAYDFRDVVGPVRIDIAVDPSLRLSEFTTTNNTASIQRTVLPRGVAPVFPAAYDVVRRGSSDTVRLLVANPSRVPVPALSPRIEVEIAEEPLFSNPALRLRKSAEPVFTHFDAVLPTGAAVRRWFWRARLVSDADAQQWSSTLVFYTADGPVVQQHTWRQDDSLGFAANDRVALRVREDGAVAPGSRPLRLEAFSAAANQVEIITAVLRVDGKDVSPNRRGFNVAVIDTATGSVSDTLVFDTYAGTAVADAMERFLRDLPADRILLVAVKDDANGWPPVSPNGSNITPQLRAALKLFGAQLIDSVGFQDSYALIGRKSDPGSARDLWMRYGSALAADTIEIPSRLGTMRSPVIGPATVWSTARLTGTLTGSSSIDLSLFAAGASGDTLLAQYPSLDLSQDLDISAIPASLHPTLRLEATLRGTGTDVLMSAWEARFESRFPELGITSQVVRAESSELQEGDPYRVRVDVYNAGTADADSVEVAIRLPGDAAGRSVSTMLQRVPAGRGSFGTAELSLPTAGLRGEIAYDITVGSTNRRVEYYRGNNTYSDHFITAKDADRPVLEVLFDDVTIANNDYVSPRPRITMTLRDDSPLPVTDTSSVQIFLDGSRVWLNANPVLRYEFPSSGSEKALIVFTPDLMPAGTNPRAHTLAVSGRDASGNAADTIPYQVRFYVSSVQGLDNVYPFPSPTAGPMDFTFRVTGTRAPERARVKIYTVAGRLIREIEAEAGSTHIGFNRVSWDGRDGDGADLANGVYFFKLLLDYGTDTIEQVGKFSVLK